MDLSSVAPNSTPPRLVNSQLVSLPPVGILNLLYFICIILVTRIWSYSYGICAIKMLIIIIIIIGKWRSWFYGKCFWFDLAVFSGKKRSKRKKPLTEVVATGSKKNTEWKLATSLSHYWIDLLNCWQLPLTTQTLTVQWHNSDLHVTSLSCVVENGSSSLDEDSGCSERCKMKHELQLLIKTSTTWFLNNHSIVTVILFSKIYCGNREKHRHE